MEDKTLLMLCYWKSNRMPILLIILVSLGLNWNTVYNDYALDDSIIIIQNLNVQEGISGIPAIMTTNAFQGYMDMTGVEIPLAGGRYRPLSIVTFAIEQSFFGKTLGSDYRAASDSLRQIQADPTTSNNIKTKQLLRVDKINKAIIDSNNSIASFRHFVQLLLFALCLISIHLFLVTFFFKERPFLATLAVMIFAVLPVHAEVVANIKSRDEIMSLLFIVLTLYFSFKFILDNKKADLLKMQLFFVLALLSKEYAMILPLIIVVGWLTVLKIPFSKVFDRGFWLLGVVLIGFIFIRFTLTANHSVSSFVDVLNDPYLYASAEQSFASKTAIILEYLRVLVLPLHLSSDYSYSHFDYIPISNWKFILGAFFYLILLSGLVYWYKKRSVLAFPLFIFIGFLVLINNFFFNLGATMGERLIFHSSFGLCLFIVLLIERLYVINCYSPKKLHYIVFSITGIVLCLFAIKTFERNRDWKSDYTLSLADVKTVKKSALLNNNAGTEIYNRAYTKFILNTKKSSIDSVGFFNELKRAIEYLNKAIVIHPRYIVAFQNRGLCYYRLNLLNKASEDWVKAAELLGGSNSFLIRNSYVFYNQGLNFGSKKQFDKAVYPLFVASKMNSEDAKVWNDLGGAYFMTAQFNLCFDAFSKCLVLQPENQSAIGGRNAAGAIYKLEEEYLKDTNNVQVKKELALAYSRCGVEKEFFRIKL